METLILEGIPLTVPQDRAKLLVKINKKKSFLVGLRVQSRNYGIGFLIVDKEFDWTSYAPSSKSNSR